MAFCAGRGSPGHPHFARPTHRESTPKRPYFGTPKTMKRGPGGPHPKTTRKLPENGPKTAQISQATPDDDDRPERSR